MGGHGQPGQWLGSNRKPFRKQETEHQALVSHNFAQAAGKDFLSPCASKLRFLGKQQGGRGTQGPGSVSCSSLAPPCGSDLPLQLVIGMLTACLAFSLTGPAGSVCGTAWPMDVEIKVGGTSEIRVPPGVRIAAEIALKPDHLPQGQVPTPGFGMDLFPASSG